jgi:hypothetical protein
MSQHKGTVCSSIEGVLLFFFILKEMPFKDTADSPEPIQGWSPERSMKLGASMLHAVLAVLPQLR